MMKLERSNIRNECNSRNGLRCDISMIVVVVRSHPGHARCSFGAWLNFGQGSFRRDSALDLQDSPPSLSLHASSHDARL
jgi:hypothetical protein